MPTDLERKMRVWLGDFHRDPDHDVEHTIEGKTFVLLGQIEANLNCRYISNTVSANDYDSLFSEALALKLAYSLSYSFNQSTALRERLKAEYMEQLSEAKSVDSQETDEFTNDPDEMWDDFEEARFSYSWLGGRYPQANVSNFRLQ